MRKIHQKLHLQHHRHTGHLLRHKHTSYRGLALVIGLAGAAVIGVSAMARVTADSLYVYARIPAPIPTDAASITDPKDGTSTHDASITVSGACPVITPSVIVAILDNDSEAGSVACDSDNNFQIALTLLPGKNVLVARTYTITGDSGPDSGSVTITYIAPLPPRPLGTADGTNSGGPTRNVPPLILAIDRPFITFGPARDAVWSGSITGGIAPYQVHVDWGDGSTTKADQPQPGSTSFRHHYHAMQPYDITIRATDTSGQVVVRHYAAVTPYQSPAIGLFTSNGPTLWNGRGMFGVYGAYLVLLALFGWLWVRAHPFAYATVSSRHQRTRHRNARRH
ncbi:MAG TPA: hypothetical protein VLE99_05035 [Candidatus Saccharimonadales bacterium]|nr:hypothetical protein [Candidatus Saccharimonadales bacterium]